MPLYSYMFAICPRGIPQTWSVQRSVSYGPPYTSLPSMGRSRLRPGSITQRLTPKVNFCVFLFLGEGEVQEDNNGKLNPSHFVGPSRSQGHGRPWFSLCYPPEPQQYSLKCNLRQLQYQRNRIHLQRRWHNEPSPSYVVQDSRVWLLGWRRTCSSCG